MWDKAQLEERHTILKGFLDCVYVDLAEPPTLVGIKPKPQFLEFLGRVGTEEGAPGKSENEDSDAFSCIGVHFDGMVETGERACLRNTQARRNT